MSRSWRVVSELNLRFRRNPGHGIVDHFFFSCTALLGEFVTLYGCVCLTIVLCEVLLEDRLLGIWALWAHWELYPHLALSWSLILSRLFVFTPKHQDTTHKLSLEKSMMSPADEGRKDSLDGRVQQDLIYVTDKEIMRPGTTIAVLLSFWTKFTFYKSIYPDSHSGLGWPSQTLTTSGQKRNLTNISAMSFGVQF